MLKVKEAAELAGVSVRTLHHYDEIGLLHPEEATESGYRLYSPRDLKRLQQILFFRELGFPLKQIKAILHDPGYREEQALRLHRDLLLEKRRRLDALIANVERTIQHERGERDMSDRERFEGFDFGSNPHEQEARERWGDKAVDEASGQAGAMGEQGQQEMNALYRRLASLRELPPESEEAQAAIGEWYAFLQRFTAYSPEMFRQLGEMYVADERFTASIDRFGAGLAAFMKDAMAVYADRA
ncbi:MerR family transcriptional regulator [Paenibacillus albicereus]|uniref:MerR family transcriptional regulator n=1 Tax=Paenibacillus albicereus TaxID=2726185 RepID=A0A6H2H2H2_9BACL|nr:MerR family transcriptional regulator [Paenibacillus albicereus]QJC53616.1 MerR family transcriptional regulator [Paenibacillus albicereus]